MARMRDVRQNKVKKSFTAGTLHAAQQRLVEACGGPKEVAALLGRSLRQTQRFVDPSLPRYFDANEIFILEQRAGRMFVTGWVAHAQSAALLHFPAGAARPLRAHFARVAKRFATLFAIEAERGEGALDKRTAGQLLNADDDLISAASDLRVPLERLAK